ncbi:hypothetical protein RclHR1_00800005 [Rhizophagus clarus]|nr:hypothetical protein RclHR1_00800005 [Rhizophagus clarus]
MSEYSPLHTDNYESHDQEPSNFEIKADQLNIKISSSSILPMQPEIIEHMISTPSSSQTMAFTPSGKKITVE